jgi:hypothetical protein
MCWWHESVSFTAFGSESRWQLRRGKVCCEQMTLSHFCFVQKHLSQRSDTVQGCPAPRAVSLRELANWPELLNITISVLATQ